MESDKEFSSVEEKNLDIGCACGCSEECIESVPVKLSLKTRIRLAILSSLSNMRVFVLISNIIMLGSIIASILSYAANHSIAWTIFHGFIGWPSVAYFAFFK